MLKCQLLISRWGRAMLITLVDILLSSLRNRLRGWRALSRLRGLLWCLGLLLGLGLLRLLLRLRLLLLILRLLLGFPQAMALQSNLCCSCGTCDKVPMQIAICINLCRLGGDGELTLERCIAWSILTLSRNRLTTFDEFAGLHYTVSALLDTK